MNEDHFIISWKTKFQFFFLNAFLTKKKILYSILWIGQLFSKISVFCNKLILKTRIKVTVHPLSPPTLLLVTTKYRGTPCPGACFEEKWKVNEILNIYTEFWKYGHQMSADRLRKSDPYRILSSIKTCDTVVCAAKWFNGFVVTLFCEVLFITL